jgi:hypothetical protein
MVMKAWSKKQMHEGHGVMFNKTNVDIKQLLKEHVNKEKSNEIKDFYNLDISDKETSTSDT